MNIKYYNLYFHFPYPFITQIKNKKKS